MIAVRPSIDHPHGEIDSQREYKVRGILQEKKKTYLIDWEDDEVTGESYPPTWEPKANANQLAIDEWESRKKQDQPTPRKRGRPSRVVESSPTDQGSSQDTNGRTLSTRNGTHDSQPEAEVAESPVHASRALAPSVQLRALAVQISDPPSSFRHGEYERFSPHSVASPGQSSVEGSVGASGLPFSSIQEDLVQETTAPQASEKQSSLPSSGETSQNIPNTRAVQTSEPAIQAEPSQSESQDEESLFIPDSQSQCFEEASTFQGFSPYGRSQATSSEALPVAQLSAGTSPEDSRPTAAVGETFEVPSQKGTSTSEVDRSQSVESQNLATLRTVEKAGSQQADTPDPITESPSKIPSQQGDTPIALQAASAPEEAVSFGPHVGALHKPQPVSTTDDQTRESVAADQSSTSVENEPRLEHQSGKDQERRSVPSQRSGGPTTSSPHTEKTSVAQPEASLDEQTSITQAILISSESQSSSSAFISQPDFEPPTAGQRPPPSSLSYGYNSADRSSRYIIGENTAQEGVAAAGVPHCQLEGDQGSSQSQPAALTQPSSAFKTQLPYFPSPLVDFKVQPASHSHSIGAQFIPDLPTPARPLSLPPRRTPESSPWPSIPSRTLETIGESAPPRIGTLSSNSTPSSPHKASSMAGRSSGELASKLRAAVESRRSASRDPSVQPASSLPPNMTAEVAAARLASPLPVLQDGTRSPSTVPALEPMPVISKEEMNTSERYETLLPQAQNGSSESQGRDQSGVAISPGLSRQAREPDLDPEVANYHVVPVSLSAHQRDQYFQNIYYHKEAIERFLQLQDPSIEQLQEVERIIERLRDIATHPDLVNEDTLSQVSTPERQAQWDVASSAKFRFLRELVGELDAVSLQTHVAVVAKADRIPGMLETFLQGVGIPYARNPSSTTTPPADGKAWVSVVDLNGPPLDAVRPAHVVVILDGNTSHRHPTVRALRRHTKNEDMSGFNQWAMLLQLVVPRTVEHIELCLVRDLTHKARARLVLHATQQLRHESGRLEAGQTPPQQAAALIARFLDDPEATDWPLEGPTAIEELDNSTQTDLETAMNGSAGAQDDGNKRPYGALGSISPIETSKRPRLDLQATDTAEVPMTINPLEMDITHVSDSVDKVTQSLVETDNVGLSYETCLHERQLKGLQAQLDDLERDLEGLQYRFEEQRMELASTKSALDEANSTAMTAMERMNQAMTSSGTLRTERTELKQKLEDANKKLLEHEIPERREYEELRLALEKATLDKEKSDKRAETAQRDLDWTRSAYQESSSRALELAEQSRDLEAKLAVTERLASDQQIRAQQESGRNRDKALATQNRKLKQLLSDREALLKLKDEELQRLKDANRGRMGTRGNSVPRSPRLGSPMRGRVSRQPSPAAGELKPKGMHPLRNSG